MKLKTLWRAYRRTKALKESIGRSLFWDEEREKSLSRRIRQVDKLERAIDQRIAAIEAGEGGK